MKRLLLRLLYVKGQCALGGMFGGAWLVPGANGRCRFTAALARTAKGDAKMRLLLRFHSSGRIKVLFGNCSSEIEL